MIVYFDTSAVIPLMVEQPGSTRAAQLWDLADHVVAVRLLHVEARAALAQAHRLGRLSAHSSTGSTSSSTTCGRSSMSSRSARSSSGGPAT